MSVSCDAVPALAPPSSVRSPMSVCAPTSGRADGASETAGSTDPLQPCGIRSQAKIVTLTTAANTPKKRRGIALRSAGCRGSSKSPMKPAAAHWPTKSRLLAGSGNVPARCSLPKRSSPRRRYW